MADRFPRRRLRRSMVGWVMLVLLLIVSGLLPAGCGRAERAAPASDDSFQVSLTTAPTQPLVGQGHLILTFADDRGRAIDDAKVEVVGNMSHAGMVPVEGIVEESGAGQYRVRMGWSMAGDWFVDVRFTLADGQMVARRFPVSVGAR